MLKNAEELHEKIEHRFNVRKCPEYADLVHPKFASRIPFDGWFNLKEAYSSKIVESILKSTGNVNGNIVIDPFCGSGSTLVGARNSRALHGIGIEINPFFYLLEKSKMTRIDIAKTHSTAKSMIRNAMKSKESIDPPKLTIIEDVFGENLQPVLRIRNEIEKINEIDIRDFLMAGLGCILEKVSRSKKDGNGLRYPENKIQLDVQESLKRQYNRMFIDKMNLQNKKFMHDLFNDDCRNVDFSIHDVTHCIFSPPYANCFDYTETYKIELWTLGFIKEYEDLKKLREKTLSSHLNKQYHDVNSPRNEIDELLNHIEWDKVWGKEKIKNMLSSYFNDMKEVFLKMNGMMTKDGLLACIVGNSAYGGVVIPTDLFLSLILEDCEFSVKEIRVARKLKTSSQQTKGLKYNNYLRESIIIARKN